MVGRAEATAILEADATWWLYELARCHLSARGAPWERLMAEGRRGTRKPGCGPFTAMAPQTRDGHSGASTPPSPGFSYTRPLT